MTNSPIVRDARRCLASDETGKDISDCTVEHACRYMGSGIGHQSAHWERRRLVAASRRK